jgi:predicted alpha/beta-fold hydrolase
MALMYLKHIYPNAPLLGVGFSLGANVLTRYLAEDGIHSRLIAGCALACVGDVLFYVISNLDSSRSSLGILQGMRPGR